MADVFISYAREDLPAAKALADLLSQAGLSVWWDRRMVPGDSFGEVIEREILLAKAVIVLWSSHAVESRWVREEAAIAADRGILIPGAIEPDLEPPLGLRSIHTADLTSLGVGKAPDMMDILSAVRRLVATHDPTRGSTTDATVQLPVRRRRRWLPWMIWVVLGVAATSIAINTDWLAWNCSDADPRLATAVLPFVDHSYSPDHRARFGQGIQQWLTGALTDKAIWNMVSVKLSRELEFERSLLEPDHSAEELIHRIVGGSYVIRDDSVSVDAVLVDPGTGYVANRSRITALGVEIREGVNLLAENLASKPREIPSSLRTQKTPVTAMAIEEYVRGILELSRTRPRDAHEWFAASSVTGYAPAESAAAVVAPFEDLDVPRAVVFPFINVGTQLADTLTTEQVDALVRGLAEMMTVDLAQEERLQVLDRVHIDAILRELELVEEAPLNSDTAVKAGRLLAADLAVLGTFVVLGEDVLVEAQVIDVRSSRVVRSFSEQGPLQQLFDVHDSIAEQICMMDLPTRADASLLKTLIGFLEMVGLEDETQHWRVQLEGAH